LLVVPSSKATRGKEVKSPKVSLNISIGTCFNSKVFFKISLPNSSTPTTLEVILNTSVSTA
jgi:hypothetical protein